MTIRNFSLLFFLLPVTLFSQVQEEVLTLQKAHRALPVAAENTRDTIALPIADDFSWKKSYPNPKFWADKNVFVNSTICNGPFSIGVATFDGTDENGFPYNINQNGSDSVADYLTSRYIDFANPPSNLMLSFFYQRGGFGELPETDDSLVVEFWSPIDSAWQRAWSTQGTGLPSAFQPAIIPISDPNYLQDGFRFRFAAYGARNGMFDIWNIDYVELDENRTLGDTIIVEPAFVRPHPYLIQTFTHIPWFVYSNGLLKNSLTFTYRRNGPTPPGGWSLNLGKYTLAKDGVVIDDNLVVPVISSAPHNADLDFSVQLASPPMSTPTAEFELFMRTWFDGTAEGYRNNDTVERTIPFRNYYAFDDGSAERAYGILNQSNARLAIAFQPLQPDSLKGLYLNLAHAGTDATLNRFRIAIWENNNGQPGQEIYVSDSVYQPKYGFYHNDFVPFELDNAVYIPGAVFIGIIQTNASAIHMGLDQNTTNATQKFYGDGFTWFQSLVSGTVMLRPYMRHTPLNMQVAEHAQTKPLPLLIYPNPAKHTLHLEIESAHISWQLYNTTGQIVLTGNEKHIDVSSIPRGVYILKVAVDKSVLTEKVILQ